MRKNVLILVCAVVLFSLFNTTKTNFMFWNNPEINNDYIIFPDIPISYDNDISLFGLFINFFSDLDLDYTINNSSISNESLHIVMDPFVEEPNEPENPIEEMRNLRDVDSIASVAIVSKEVQDEEFEEPIEEVVVLIEEVVVPIEEVVVVPIEEVVVRIEEVVVVPIEEVVVPIEEVVVPIEEVVVVPIEEVVASIEEIEVYVKSDRDNIIDNPKIKDNAKELILESLDNGVIAVSDVEKLLFEYVGKIIKKKHVKELIKSKR